MENETFNRRTSISIFSPPPGNNVPNIVAKRDFVTSPDGLSWTMGHWRCVIYARRMSNTCLNRRYKWRISSLENFVLRISSVIEWVGRIVGFVAAGFPAKEKKEENWWSRVKFSIWFQRVSSPMKDSNRSSSWFILLECIRMLRWNLRNLLNVWSELSTVCHIRSLLSIQWDF